MSLRTGSAKYDDERSKALCVKGILRLSLLVNPVYIYIYIYLLLFHLPVFISIINISRNGLEIMHTSVIINYIRLPFQNCYYAQINNLSKHIWKYPFPNILASTRCYQYFKILLIWGIINDKEFFMLHWFLVCIFIVYLWFFFCELSYLYSLQFYIYLFINF